MKPLKLVFVGQNPKDERSVYRAFDGAKSFVRLVEWYYLLSELGVPTCPRPLLINVSDIVGDFRANHVSVFNMSIIKRHHLRGYAVVALGRYTSRALRGYGIPHVKLPHPSGMNRQLNNGDCTLLYLEGAARLLRGKYTGKGVRV